jgi:predicted permease
MSKIFAIVWKDFKIRSSSKTELLFFIILPVIFTLLLSGLFFGNSSS